ncbi:chaplin [Streptomyces sp. BH-SS-21]|uniref:Chaplin n=1 Tax=Streptomyces liliiviolaceus TaxID=2823109 RepID=A0A941B9N9_9ACTN|nr:chaplin [Streptomyces liliiviolaceus]MBQ0850273.1 chaplin [Streptomyces liliiviolaceus]
MKSRVIKSAALLAAAGSIILGGGAVASADSGAQGAAVGSPGVLSGNLIQVPIHVPVNVCGNTVSIIGLLNPAFGNSCSNGGHHQGGMWR